MTRLIHHARTALRSNLAQDLCAFAVLGLFIVMIIIWSAYVADHVSLRRYF